MGFMLKSSLNVILALLMVFASAGGVEERTSEDWIRQRTGVDIGALILLESTDTHGGMFFDGGSLDVYECDGDSFEQIEGDWRPLPLDENLSRILYGGYRDPQIKVPRIENGMYLFFDRHAEAEDPSDDAPLFERASINMSLFIYDSDGGRLYYYEYDT